MSTCAASVCRATTRFTGYRDEVVISLQGGRRVPDSKGGTRTDPQALAKDRTDVQSGPYRRHGEPLRTPHVAKHPKANPPSRAYFTATKL